MSAFERIRNILDEAERVDSGVDTKRIIDAIENVAMRVERVEQSLEVCIDVTIMSCMAVMYLVITCFAFLYKFLQRFNRAIKNVNPVQIVIDSEVVKSAST